MSSIAESLISRSSRQSQQVLANVGAKSMTKLSQLQDGGTGNDDSVAAAWQAFGQYVAKNLRQGRGVVIPKFGTFTFTAPDVSLAGTTNQDARDLKNRIPVFLINKDFVLGRPVRPGIAHATGIRPYNNQGSSGAIPLTKVNYIELSTYSGFTKESTRFGIERVLKELAAKAKAGQAVRMNIPMLGVFCIKSSVAAVVFENYVMEETKGVTNKTNDWKARTGNHLTENALGFHNRGKTDSFTERPASRGSGLWVSEDAEKWLSSNLNINVGRLTGASRVRKSNSVRNFPVAVRKESPNRYTKHGFDKYNKNMKDIPLGLAREMLDKYEELGIILNMKEVGSAGVVSLKEFQDSCDMLDLEYSHTHAQIEKMVKVTNVISSSRVNYVDFLNKLPGLVEDIKSLNANKGTDAGLAIHGESKAMKSFMRPMSAQSARMSVAGSEMSRGSRPGSAQVRRRPHVSAVTINSLARDIWSKKQELTEIARKKNSRAAVKVTPSELLTILRKGRVEASIDELNALLAKCDIVIRGASVSILDLLSGSESLLSGGLLQEKKAAAPQDESVEPTLKPQDFYILQIRDTFARTGIPLLDICTEFSYPDKTLDKEKFCALVGRHCSAKVTHSEANLVFEYCNPDRTLMPFRDFQRLFKGRGEITKADEELLKLLRAWLRLNQITSEQGFEKFLTLSRSIHPKKLSQDEFIRALKGANLNFNPREIAQIFTVLDSNSDGLIDYPEWSRLVFPDYGPLEELRQTIFKHELEADDVLLKLNIDNEADHLTQEQFANSLISLDRNLPKSRALEMAKMVDINKDNKIEVKELLAQLTKADRDSSNTEEWLNSKYKHIQSRLRVLNKEEEVVGLFEHLDSKNEGSLSLNDFRKVLRESNLDMSWKDIDRLVLALDQDGRGKVDYNKFVNRLKLSDKSQVDPIKSSLVKINRFMEQNGVSAGVLLKKLYYASSKHGNVEEVDSKHVKVSHSRFVSFLLTKVCKTSSKGEITKVVDAIDVNKDGYVDIYDLETCLQNVKLQSVAMNSTQGFGINQTIFPTEALNEEKASQVIKMVREALLNRRISYRECFDRLDTNKDGFLSIGELSNGFEDIVAISQPMKNGLFALMDKNGIGLVDYNSFLAVLKQSLVEKKKEQLKGDNWDWEMGIIEDIRKWIHREAISVETAYKNFDLDFDGFVDKNDLNQALINVLKVPAEDIVSSKVDRLFRIMDRFKRGRIQLSDFKQIADPNNTLEFSSTTKFSTGFKAERSLFDWKHNAMQQVGLILSQKFTSTNASFSTISEGTDRITYVQFKSWLEVNRALAGFNLTESLVQQLFGDMEPHKKGYLTEVDWSNAFSKFNWNVQKFDELKETVLSNFANLSAAFKYFAHCNDAGSTTVETGDNAISLDNFTFAVRTVNPDRFNVRDIKVLWDRFSRNGDLESVDFHRFKLVFGDSAKFYGSSSNFNKTATGKRAQSAPGGKREDALEKLRHQIKASSKPLDAVFREIDEDGSGKISALEFRHGIRKLGLALSSREIDELLNRIDANKDGMIDYEEFKSKFKVKEVEQRIENRSHTRLSKLKEQIYSYLLTPRDAFRQFDPDRKGILSFQAFTKMLNHISEAAKEPRLSFAIIKDLFDLIDIRKDGIVDMTEWTQSFNQSDRNVATPAGSMGSVPKTAQSSLSGRTAVMNSRFDGSQNLEETKDYDLVIILIGKNRRLLQESFERITGKAGVIEFGKAREILASVLNQHSQSDAFWNKILRIADKEKLSVKIDYRFFLDVYKERLATKDNFPR